MCADPILLCYDGSEDAKRAIAHAAELFVTDRALVLSAWQPAAMAYAYEWPGVTYVPGMEALDTANEVLARRLAAEGAALAEAAGLAAEPVAVRSDGPLWRTIVAEADACEVAAIVLGSRGRSAPRELMLGSVARAVGHHARRPVLVARHGARPGHGPVLLAYDGSLDARLAILRTAALLGSADAHVLTVSHHVPAVLAHSWPGLEYTTDLRGVNAAASAAAERQAAEGAAIAAEVGLAATAVTRQAHGPLWRVILDVADECDASAIVLGSHGLGSVRARLLGGVCDGAVHHAHRPVLIVHGPRDVAPGAGDAALALAEPPSGHSRSR
jgi:nucleotide-binding universal stress UspA family protein